jgi:hypothetical protein
MRCGRCADAWLGVTSTASGGPNMRPIQSAACSTDGAVDHRLPLISANGQAPVAATLEGGKRLDVRRCEDGWCLIDVGDTEG